jgi:hypothetical protein
MLLNGEQGFLELSTDAAIPALIKSRRQLQLAQEEKKPMSAETVIPTVHGIVVGE